MEEIKRALTPIIDYQKIADAQKYYQNNGYKEISVPWVLQSEAYFSTQQFAQSGNRDFKTLDGYLNASGEQGFLELMLSGVSLGKHLCISPCFRDDAQDELHHTYFIKVELIDTLVSSHNLKRMIKCCQEFFDHYLWQHTSTKIVAINEADDSYDIVDSKYGIELGSYGIRSYKDFCWIYGTGLALPRLDTVLNKFR